MNPIKAFQYISIRPFDTKDEPGRTNERYRLAAWSAITNILSKLLSMIIMIESVRLTIPYLGTERFGIWITIASFFGIMSFLDLGIGNALTNRVAHNATQNNLLKLQTTISGGMGVLFILGLSTSITLVLLANYTPWEQLIKVTSTDLYVEIKDAGTILGGLFGLQIISNGIQKTFLGLQKAYIANITSTISNILTLALLYYAASQQLNISGLLLITLGCGILVNGTLIIFLIKKKLLTISNIKLSITSEYKPLVYNGSLFFLLQLAAIIGWGMDSLIISSTLGAAQVAAFGVAQKMFQLISQPLSIVNAPLWSAYADAHARCDTLFLQKTLKFSLISSLIIALAMGAILIVFGQDIGRYWTNNNLTIPISIMVALFFWTCCESMGSAFSIFLNGCSIIKPQIFAVTTLIIASIPVKIYCINNFGISGMIAGFTVLYTLNFCFFIGISYKNDVFEMLEGRK